jgi:DNA-binding NtrC family response regulator
MASWSKEFFDLPSPAPGEAAKGADPVALRAAAKRYRVPLMERGSGESAGLILVVDDDPDLVALVSRWLAADGFEVEEVSTAEDALVSLASLTPDGICLDLNLPGMSGLDALKRIRTTHQKLPVVMLTADREVDSVVKAIQLGAYDYIPKPLDRTKLITTMRNAVERHRMALRLARLEREAEGRGYGSIVGRSAPMKEFFRQLDRVATSDITVLVHGESGTGKELVARAIHDASGRRAGPMVSFNCAAIAENLAESELFGHEKGAFTGAVSQRKGAFEQADGGTIFLDEVAELSLPLQAKLLRVLQERSFRRVGGNTDIRSDFRLVAASHRDLAGEVARGHFREDLYFRLAVFELEVPPLRARGEDVILLAEMFMQSSTTPVTLAREARDALLAWRWPGNVRELQNAVQRAMVVCSNGVIHLADLPRRVQGIAEPIAAPIEPPPPSAPRPAPSAPTAAAASADPAVVPGDGSLRGMEKTMLEQAHKRTGGNVTEVVRQLGIGRTTVYRKLKKYGLR